MDNSKILQLDFGFDIEPEVNQNPRPKSHKKAKADFVFDFMDCLTSPVIVFKSAWQNDIPKDILKNISLSRITCLMMGEQMASLTEVVAYMMPRTFESPLQHEWVNIYTWAGLQYANQFKSTEQKKEMASAMKEIAPEKLSDYEQHLLKDLRIWIYEKRRKALKQSMKSDNRIKTIEIVNTQENLFDS